MTGVALTVAGVLDLVIVGSIARVRYGVTLSMRAVKVVLVQFPLIMASWAVSCCMAGLWRWVAGLVLLALSAVYSFHYLKKHTSFIRSVSDRLSKKIRS